MQDKRRGPLVRAALFHIPKLEATGVSGELPVAVLELLAGAARAGLVAADLAPARWIGRVTVHNRDLALFDCGILQAAAAVIAEGGSRQGILGWQDAILRLIEADLDAHQVAGDLLAQMADQPVEELEGFLLVLVQRVALGIAAPADNLAEMVERDEMLAPEMVERLQQHLLLDIGHDLFGVAGDALGIGQVGLGADAFAEFRVGDAFLLGPVLDRQIEIEEVMDVFAQASSIPLLCIGLFGDAAGYDVLDDAVAHVVDGLAHARLAHEIAALLEDDLALVV